MLLSCPCDLFLFFQAEEQSSKMNLARTSVPQDVLGDWVGIKAEQGAKVNTYGLCRAWKGVPMEGEKRFWRFPGAFTRGPGSGGHWEALPGKESDNAW